MFKAPARSKLRLRAEIGDLAAAGAERLFACAREDAAAWPGPVCYAPAEAADAAWLEDAFGRQPLVIAQGSGNLGARLSRVDEALRAQGLERRIYIGIDCPALDARYLDAAQAALSRADVVIGPAADGGAVLIGARCRLPDLAPLPWSTAALGSELAALAAAADLRVGKLDALPDVDTLADLLAAAAAVRGDARPARRALAQWVQRACPAAEAGR